MIDLQPFCGTEDARWYLMKPFSMGEFSYATNGHILVRQPRRADVPDIDVKAPKFKPDNALVGLDAAKFYVPTLQLPTAPAAGPCPACDCRKFEHDCPDCECTCETCNGSGEGNPERNISTAIGGSFFALNYVRLMAALPDLEIANTAEAIAVGAKPLLFRFEGGVGALMPMLSPRENHIEIERAAGGEK